jgi:hypothetical protein
MLLPQYPPIDVMVLLVGVNDLGLRLQRDVEYRTFDDEPPDYHRNLSRHAFYVAPGWDEDLPFYMRTEIWGLLRKVRALFRSKPHTFLHQDETGQWVMNNRAHRRRALAFRDELPDLSASLQEYRENLSRIVDLARARGVQVVLMTQPSMWRRDLPDELKSLLWMGRIGELNLEEGNEYYTVDALAEGMKRYNAVLLEVCEQRDLECIDLASLLAKDGSVFYDDVHFHERGAREVAQIVANTFVEIMENQSDGR